jgi:hypothetical protein
MDDSHTLLMTDQSDLTSHKHAYHPGPRNASLLSASSAHHTSRTNRSTPAIHHAIPLTLYIRTASQYCTSHRRLYFDVHVELTPVRLHQTEILENRCEKGVYANNDALPKI